MKRWLEGHVDVRLLQVSDIEQRSPMRVEYNRHLDTV